MTLIEKLQADLATAKSNLESLLPSYSAVQAEITRIEADIAALPAEFHTIEYDVWRKIKDFYVTIV